MLKLKTKWFSKWQKKNLITDDKLLETIINLTNKIGSTKLGMGLFKVRTHKTGHGKSGSFRTIIVYKEDDIAIFIYGFSKNEKENLDITELEYFKKLSKDLLSISFSDINYLIKTGEFIAITEIL